VGAIETMTIESDQTKVVSGGAKGVVSRIRNYFLTGLIVAGPAAVTLWLIWWFVTWVDNLVRPVIPLAYRPETYLPVNIPGFGLIIALVALTLLGFLTANLVGRSLLEFGESLLGHMPIVRPIYRTTKQIFETLFSNSESGNVVAGVPDPAADRLDCGASAADGTCVGVFALHAEPDHRVLLLRAAARRGRSRHHRRAGDDAAHFRRHHSARRRPAEQARRACRNHAGGGRGAQRGVTPGTGNASRADSGEIARDCRDRDRPGAAPNPAGRWPLALMTRRTRRS
jgi:hypothetical protein